MKLIPKNRPELQKMIQSAISNHGNEADLNHIDTSLINEMSSLFAYQLREFNGNISQWDVSNVTNMSNMFSQSSFTGDISQWDVSNVKRMKGMFLSSKFDGDISEWNVSNVLEMRSMFSSSIFKQDISRWDVSNVFNMDSMFHCAEFNNDISLWNVSKVKFMHNIFVHSKFQGDVSLWNPKNNEHYFISSYDEEGNETQSFTEYQTHCVRQKLFNRSSFQTEAPAIKAL